MDHLIFLFGEAERGEFCTPLPCRNLAHLAQTLGHPPEESEGISCAVQALLYERKLIYFRVREEGFSLSDYMKGIAILETGRLGCQVSAIAMPGVGDAQIIDASQLFCMRYHSLLILSPQDLYDYLTVK